MNRFLLKAAAFLPSFSMKDCREEHTTMDAILVMACLGWIPKLLVYYT